MVEFGQGFIGCVHRHHTRQPQAIFVRTVRGCEVVVEPRAQTEAEIVEIDAGDAKAERGVEHGDVNAQLIHALVQQPGDHGRGAIEGVLRGHTPPTVVRRPRRATVVGATTRRNEQALELAGAVAGEQVGAEALPQVRQQAGHMFDHMAVDVDDGVGDFVADRSR